jgi:plastocyanin
MISIVSIGVALAAMTGCASDPSDVPAAAAATAPEVSAPAAVLPVASDAAAATGASVTVKALDNSFREQDLTIAAGTEVVFENVGRNEHNVIPDPNSIQGWGVSDQEFGPGATYSHVFTEPGVYAYVCTIHGVKGKGMVGTITVTA